MPVIVLHVKACLLVHVRRGLNTLYYVSINPFLLDFNFLILNNIRSDEGLGVRSFIIVLIGFGYIQEGFRSIN